MFTIGGIENPEEIFKHHIGIFFLMGYKYFLNEGNSDWSKGILLFPPDFKYISLSYMSIVQIVLKIKFQYEVF